MGEHVWLYGSMYFSRIKQKLLCQLFHCTDSSLDLNYKHVHKHKYPSSMHAHTHTHKHTHWKPYMHIYLIEWLRISISFTCIFRNWNKTKKSFQHDKLKIALYIWTKENTTIVSAICVIKRINAQTITTVTDVISWNACVCVIIQFQIKAEVNETGINWTSALKRRLCSYHDQRNHWRQNNVEKFIIAPNTCFGY